MSRCVGRLCRGCVNLHYVARSTYAPLDFICLAAGNMNDLAIACLHFAFQVINSWRWRVALRRTKWSTETGILIGLYFFPLQAWCSMRFIHRGMNQPCIDLRTTRCYITSQVNIVLVCMFIGWLAYHLEALMACCIFLYRNILYAWISLTSESHMIYFCLNLRRNHLWSNSVFADVRITDMLLILKLSLIAGSPSSSMLTTSPTRASCTPLNPSSQFSSTQRLAGAPRIRGSSFQPSWTKCAGFRWRRSEISTIASSFGDHVVI